MAPSADTLCVTLEELTAIYEELLGRSVAKKWAVIGMDITRLNRIVEEEEVLATECRQVEERRLAATRELASSLVDATARSRAARLPSLSDLLPKIAPAGLRERLARAAERLRGVLAMMGRLTRANRELITQGISHFERFFREIQRANAPQTVTYNRYGMVAVRDPAHTESGLRFVDRRA